MDIIHQLNNSDWDQAYSEAVSKLAMDNIETGKLIYYPKLAFELLTEEKIFLSDKYSDGKAKNISYDIKTDSLRGANCDPEEEKILSQMMQRFNKKATLLVSQLLPDYVPFLQIARTSYRPVEVKGRNSSYKKDDTRLHVDAFSANPNQGKRILRVFSNVNPHGEDRVWRIGEPFSHVATTFLPQINRPLISGKFLQLFKITKSLRTHYDHIMLQIHNRMKKDLDYQKKVNSITVRFAPNTTWIVTTDQVSHAVSSGQYLLEQTFYLPIEAMANSELSPLRVLEKIAQKKLV